MRDVIRLKLQRTVLSYQSITPLSASIPLNSLNIHHKCTLLNNLGQYEWFLPWIRDYVCKDSSRDKRVCHSFFKRWSAGKMEIVKGRTWLCLCVLYFYYWSVSSEGQCEPQANSLYVTLQYSIHRANTSKTSTFGNFYLYH